MSTLPPQRMGPGGPAGGGPARGPGQPGAGGRGMTPAQGAQEAERRLGLPCYYAGQRVKAIVGCVACQFQINNRGVLPTCPQCGEIVWAYLGQRPAAGSRGRGARRTGTHRGGRRRRHASRRGSRSAATRPR